jgi:hypothetical protein
MHKFEKIMMKKYWTIIVIAFLAACGIESDSSVSNPLWEYHASNYHENWDGQVLPLVNQFLQFQNVIAGEDTLLMNSSSAQLIQYTDTLLAQKGVPDSITQQVWLNGLSVFRNELEAILLETSLPEKKQQFQMSTIALLHLLGDMGYRKTNVYVFEKTSNEEEIYWIGAGRTSKNMLDKKDKELYHASQLLNENK